MTSDWMVELFAVPSNTFMRCVDSSARRVLNMHHQASPVSRAPSMPAVDSSYIPPVPPLIQDYRPYYPTPADLPGRLPLSDQPMSLSGRHLLPGLGSLVQLVCVVNGACSALQS